MAMPHRLLRENAQGWAPQLRTADAEPPRRRNAVTAANPARALIQPRRSPMGGITDENRQLPDFNRHRRNLRFRVKAHPSFLDLQITGVVIMATGVAGMLLPRRGQQGWLRRRTILRRGLRGPVVGQVDEARLPPYVMVNPGASAHESNGAQPGDLTMREAAGETVSDLPAADVAAEEDSAVAGDSAAATEVVEEYIEE